MKGQSAVQRREAVRVVKLVPAQDLVRRGNELYDMIARRAYALFESRGCVHGHDTDDWTAAESELLHTCRHDLKESAEAVIFHAELPGSFSADQLKISVEPRRVMVAGERELDMIRALDEPANTRKTAQRIFRVEQLPVDVDPSRATARLAGETLEIVMPKVATSSRQDGAVAREGQAK